MWCLNVSSQQRNRRWVKCCQLKMTVLNRGRQTCAVVKKQDSTSTGSHENVPRQERPRIHRNAFELTLSSAEHDRKVLPRRQLARSLVYRTLTVRRGYIPTRDVIFRKMTNRNQTDTNEMTNTETKYQTNFILPQNTNILPNFNKNIHKIPIKYQENTKKFGTEIPNTDLVLVFFLVYQIFGYRLTSLIPTYSCKNKILAKTPRSRAPPVMAA